ncbi:MAG: isocitrate lyase/phosphoenolpyruvate mutase family protein [Liquorilactobacillus ghanensis]|uniref:isocitrate lyase/phosphoenolpyruvate mutase family protein n=1 Tax=Liquorilactobacillus ghanensis TaxID=399370 RepID=UPI0039ECD44A
MIQKVAKVCMVPDILDQSDAQSFYLSGSDLAWQLCGSHNEGLLAASECARQLSYLRIKTNKLLFVDAQSGFGNPLNTYFTVKEFEHHGADVILINDQQFPSQTKHPQIASIYSFAGRVKAAIDAHNQQNSSIWVKLDGYSHYQLDGLQKRLIIAEKLGVTGALLNSVPAEEINKLKVNLKLGILNFETKNYPAQVKYFFE